MLKWAEFKNIKIGLSIKSKYNFSKVKEKSVESETNKKKLKKYVVIVVTSNWRESGYKKQKTENNYSWPSFNT